MDKDAFIKLATEKAEEQLRYIAEMESRQAQAKKTKECLACIRKDQDIRSLSS